MPQTHPLVSQPTSAPTRKSRADVVGGALATIIAYLIYHFHGTQLPPGVEGALATIAGFLLSYLVRDRANT